MKTGIVIIILLFSNMASSAQITKQKEFYTDSSSYDVSFYWLNLNVSKHSVQIQGNTIIKARATNRNLSKFYIELSDSLHPDSIIINGSKHNFIHSDGWLKVPLITQIQQNSFFTVEIFYKGTGIMKGFGGVISDSDYNSGILTILAEPFNASVAYPCKQYLTDKSDSVFIYLTVPKGQTAVSNGLLKGIVELPENKVLYKWETRYPTAYYLVAFAVSDYREYSYKFYDNIYNDSIFFQNFLYRDSSFFIENKENIDITVDMLKYFETITGVAYPFRKEKYGHATFPFGGGMENQTITFLSRFEFELVAHELGHSWFGNLVTCSDWQNIWINEGFAMYMGFLAMEKFRPDLVSEWLTSNKKEALKEPNGSLFIPGDQIWNDWRIFSNSITYSKGGMLVHMLRKKINNDQVFFNIFNAFLEKFAYKNANTEDFRKVAEEISGRDLKTFFQQWFYGEGFPVVKVEWYSNKENLLINTSSRGSSTTNILFNYDLELLLHLNSKKDSLITISISDTSQSFVFKLMPIVDSIEADPANSAIAKTTVSNVIPSEIKDVFIFPNPFTDSLIVLFKKNSGIHKIDLYDLKGSKINSWTTSDSQIIIPTKKISSGIYILNISDNNNNSITRKIVKRQN